MASDVKDFVENNLIKTSEGSIRLEATAYLRSAQSKKLEAGFALAANTTFPKLSLVAVLKRYLSTIINN